MASATKFIHGHRPLPHKAFAWSALQWAEAREAEYQQERSLLRSRGWLEGAQSLHRDQPVKGDFDLSKLDRNEQIAFSSIASTLAPRELWMRERNVYDIDGSLVAELYESEDGHTPIPWEVLHRIPHLDPLIFLHRPFPAVLSDGRNGRVIAIQVCGGIGSPGYENMGGYRFASTGDDRVNLLHCTFTAEVLDGSSVIDHDQVRMTFPMQGEHTLAEAVELIARRFVWGPEVNVNNEDAARHMVTCARLGIAILLYLAGHNPEITPVKLPPRPPIRANRTGKGAGKGVGKVKPPKLRNVGWELGRRMDLYAEHEAHEHAEAAATGRKMPPHRRRGHRHKFYVGPRNVEPREFVIHFIPELWVHGRPDNPDGRITPVGRPR